MRHRFNVRLHYLYLFIYLFVLKNLWICHTCSWMHAKPSSAALVLVNHFSHPLFRDSVFKSINLSVMTEICSARIQKVSWVSEFDEFKLNQSGQFVFKNMWIVWVTFAIECMPNLLFLSTLWVTLYCILLIWISLNAHWVCFHTWSEYLSPHPGLNLVLFRGL